MKRRTVLIAISLFVAALVTVMAVALLSTRSKPRIERIHIGMTRDEVDQALGSPYQVWPKPGMIGHPEWVPPPSAQRDEVWYDGDTSYIKIRVWFRDGKVDEIGTFERRHDWRPF